MTKLKVTEVQTEEVDLLNEVAAGQIRKSSNGRSVVLIVDARNSGIDLNGGEKYISVRLNEFDINEMHGGNSEEDLQQLYPILLDAELTYSEAK